jgi:hypothetical protein
MNKTTATYNASDVYQAWLDKMLELNPKWWTMPNRATRRKRDALFRVKDHCTEEVMTFARWYKMVSMYYLVARQEVIKGRRIQLGHRLGAIQARRVSRNFKNKQINWGETSKYPYIIDPVTGKRKYEKIIYHTSETYCRIAWERTRTLINERSYKFVPSQGGKHRGGFRRDFILALKANPLLETQYKQFINELI